MKNTGPKAKKKLTAKGQSRKKELLEKALDLFGEKGYHATTIDDIVKAGATGKGTFYWYWQSKDEIFLELLSNKFESYISALENIQKMKIPTTDKLIMLFTEIGNMLIKYRKLCKLIYLLISANSDEFNADVLKATNDYYSRFRKILIQFIQEGQKEGSISRDVDAQHLATIFISIVDGLLLQEKVMNTNYLHPKMGETLITVLRKGIMIQPA
ncbi:MAG: TetR/AcrR family transcriptional regulator [Proteobacteria bacterium]|nr:TetR/AcrR family transcriptional regulator [Pseudomonadota bacterium]